MKRSRSQENKEHPLFVQQAAIITFARPASLLTPLTIVPLQGTEAGCYCNWSGLNAIHKIQQIGAILGLTRHLQTTPVGI